MEQPIPVVLLCALPASGKSESRKFLEKMSRDDLQASFKIGETVQLDDYPYVDLMRDFDTALEQLGQPRAFFVSAQDCFIDGHEWAVLILMLNDDYEDLVHKYRVPLTNPTIYIMERIDRARRVLGVPEHFRGMRPELLMQLCQIMDPKCAKVINGKNKEIPDTLEGKTVVIEFARGGPHGSTFPIKPPQGYQYSLRYLSRDILAKCAMLYIWVTPEQSRKKNEERNIESADRTMFHGVPIRVMMNDYGCDDIEYLLSVSDRPHTLKIETRPGEFFYIPVGRLDNREDLTTFVRDDEAKWTDTQRSRLRAAFTEAFSGLLLQFRALHGAH